ncbi:MAG: hemolysin family protein [Solirubrobacteraceae bacterium]
MSPLLLVAVLLLVLLKGFFVAAEYSLVRSRRAHLEAESEGGVRGATLALRQLDEINDYISACQVGITMASIGIGALGEPIFVDLLKPVLQGPVGHGAAVVISVIFAYLVITSLHIIIGELVPKVYVIHHAEAVIRRVARPLQFSRVIFRPFTYVLTAASNAILRLLGVNPEAGSEEGGSPDELKRLIAESYTGGKLEENEASMLSGVFHLHEQEARQVMTPIPAVITVDVTEKVETALRRCVDSGHTRLLVTEDENRDHVKGIVHANSLAQVLLRDGPEASFEGEVREALIVPETKALDDLLADLQRQRTSVGVVVDEYGRTAGLVTIEDIIEEVVGEIDDETDPAGGAVRRLANGDWFVRGHVAVRDLEDHGLSLPVDTDAYNSVGGFVFAELGRLPKRGDSVTADGYSIRVESVRENRIEAVRIRERRAQAN